MEAHRNSQQTQLTAEQKARYIFSHWYSLTRPMAHEVYELVPSFNKSRRDFQQRKLRQTGTNDMIETAREIDRLYDAVRLQVGE